MRRRALGVVLCAVVAAASTLAFAGGETPRERATGARPTYFDDVQPLLARHCTGCHYDGGIAPFALTSFRSAYAHRDAMAQAVRMRLMPPWLAQRGTRRFSNDPSLTDREIDTIVRWARAGAPRGKPRKVAAPPAPRRAGLPSRVDLKLAPRGPYTPKPVTDDYHCFAFRWPLDRAAYVGGLAAQPGQPSEVHHVAVYLLSSAYGSLVDKWDAADPGEGYTCFGGPSGRDARVIPVQLLGGWTPGSLGGDFPAGSGILVQPGSRIVVQVHYNLEGRKPKPDRTALELKLDQPVRRGAWVFWLNVDWALEMMRGSASPASGYSFEIPPGRKNVRVSVEGDPMPLFTATSGGLELSDGFLIYGALLHMHKLGVSTRLVLERKTGREESLLAIPRWNFNEQRVYFFEKPVAFLRGDKLELECRYDNNGTRAVRWGERSSDEMCVGSLYIAERSG